MGFGDRESKQSISNNFNPIDMVDNDLESPNIILLHYKTIGVKVQIGCCIDNFLSHVIFEKSQNCSFSIQEFDVRRPLMCTILLKMKRLDASKHICTNFHQIKISRSQYNQKEIF